jgi:hypothetical protein
MHLVIDCHCGLVNQFYDISATVGFCSAHELTFSFRSCSFRHENNLSSWFVKPFHYLFSDHLLKTHPKYVPYEAIENLVTKDNSYNQTNTKTAVSFLSRNNLIEQIRNLDKEYIFIKQLWPVVGPPVIPGKFIHYVQPNPEIIDIFHSLKQQLFGENEQYNCLHYRYEGDFTRHFKITVDSLDVVFEKKIKFDNPELRTYVATSSISKLIDLSDPKYKNIVYKDEDKLNFLNFEQRAYVDFLICCSSKQAYGHSLSSFSRVLASFVPLKFYNHII